MNVSDSEIAWSILLNHGFTKATDLQHVSKSQSVQFALVNAVKAL